VVAAPVNLNRHQARKNRDPSSLSSLGSWIGKTNKKIKDEKTALTDSGATTVYDLGAQYLYGDSLR